MMLAFTRHNRTTAAIEVINDEGEPQYQCLVNRFRNEDIRWLARLWNTDVPTATAKLNEICDVDNGSTDPDVVEFDPPSGLIESILSLGGTTTEVPETSTPVAPFVIHVRNLDQVRQHGQAYTNEQVEQVFREALDQTMLLSSSREPILEWTDKDRFCCLDIDYHDTEDKPTYNQLSAMVERIRPQPFAFHMSHGYGAKLYYLAKPGYTATELAAIAGISWIGIDGRATFDLIKSSRHPCYKRSRDKALPPCSGLEDIAYIYGSGDLSLVRKLLLSDVEATDVEDWLAERGWAIGQLLQHKDCPIHPTDDPKENVLVGDRGIFCHRCHAKGYGGSTPGFVSYAALVGTIDNRLTAMVKNFCHLTQARIILTNLYPCVPPKILDDIYRVMLKIVHQPEDPRIEIAMNAGKGFVRIKGQWVTEDGTESLTDAKPAFVNSLPATKYLVRSGEDSGKLMPDANKTVAFLNAGNLSEYGYHDISFIRGCKIYGQFMPYRDSENIKVIVRQEFRNHVPQYIGRVKRMPVQDAWNLIESEFPGIDRNYIKLLIATKGASEGRLAQCPFLLITGPTGAGKSTSVHIAAGICGDKASEPIFVPHIERFRQSLMDAARTSGFVCVNEVFKYAESCRMSYTQALDPMLSLTEDSRSHVLYVGSVEFGRLPVFVLTDINIPIEVEQDRQLARRFTFYRLSQENFWSDTLIRKQIKPHELRLLSYDHNAACDSILSDVIDEFFQEPTPLFDIAERLQSGSLSNFTGETDRVKKHMLELYKLVCAAPAVIGTDAVRYSANGGWKRIDRMTESPLNEMWNNVCDGVEVERWARSRAVDAEDWTRVVGTKFTIMCEYRAYRNSIVYIRFRSTDSPKKPMWINGNLIESNKGA
jgi:hypothetical protein